MLRIAVQTKGRLNDDTMRLLTEAGIKLSIGKRNLLVASQTFPLELLFLRDDDIPQAVADGTSDVGIVGENEFVEKQKDAELVKRLGFSHCRLSLAVPKEAEYQGLNWFAGKKIATSYPEILSEFLRKNAIKANIHVISGSVEIAPSIGLADAIFDIVSSGSTLITNHLREVEVVMQSEAVLIKNTALSNDKQAILDELIFRLETIQNSADKKYLLLNAPNDKLSEIVAILPGMRSPTVLPLAQAGWSSVHSVIDEKHFWEVVSKLKAAGAEGILVLPIEKMIP
ncbi:ATP phosphoribosyltransferase [Candidatus Symbiothrix dinenymphae]|uniref:ATP phosphoribosyltransferase n=1 Tax=Candidatus Symbiothrix dinenymphae TaxID=467085 RepID=UPI0006C5DF12|nr:ATP phosphoribosyltransferase [Candidatus Symbiothrix dinenymphae]GAP73436.1 ATP phosphoribosyltransferase [Candidatus Symbiothrix dinenymphae]